MSVAITIRDVPQQVRDELAARAAGRGQSLQEFMRALMIETASRPTLDAVLQRVRARVETTRTTVPVDQILAARDADRR